MFKFNKNALTLWAMGILFAFSAFRLFHIALGNDYLNFAIDRKKLLRRGDILDRNGKPIATSRKRYNIYLTSKRTITEEQKKSLLEILDMDRQALDRLYSVKKTYLLRRYVGDELAIKIRRLRADAVLLEPVYQRFHPYEHVLSQTVGFVSFDGQGLTGIEKAYNAELFNLEGGRKDLQLKLSIDIDLQKSVEYHLKKMVDSRNAKGGSVIIQEIHTGKILSMANIPNLNLNEFYKGNEDDFVNPATSKHLEPGSIFKIFFLAYLIETRNANTKQKKYLSKSYYSLPSGEVIRDARAYGDVNFYDIVRHSINSGIVQATKKLTMNEMHDYLYQLQFGKLTGVDLPGEIIGIIPPTRQWGTRTKATIPMGHGIAVTPIQLISSFSSLVYDGKYRRPFLADELSYLDESGESVKKKMKISQPIPLFSQSTVEQVRELLLEGTSPKSTGALARKSGYISIGKTSTSQLVNKEKGGYHRDKYHSLFIGAYPAESPKLSILVIIKEPQLGNHSGGKTAAPLYSDLLPEAIERSKLVDPRWVRKIIDQPLQFPLLKKNLIGSQAPQMVGYSARDAMKVFDQWRKHPSNKHKKVWLELRGKGFVERQEPTAGDTLENGILKLFLN